MANILVPTVTDDTQPYARSYDIYSLLLKNRVIFLNAPVESQLANMIIAQLLFLNGESFEQPIHLYITSPGGDVYSGLAIYDAMQIVDAPVYTYAVGLTASMGTALLTAGERGHRYALPHATIHMHPSSSGAKGYTEDVRIAFRELERMQSQVFHLLAKHTNHSWHEVERKFERDHWMNAIEARNFGFVDNILGDTTDIVVGTEKGEFQLAG